MGDLKVTLSFQMWDDVPICTKIYAHCVGDTEVVGCKMANIKGKFPY